MTEREIKEYLLDNQDKNGLSEQDISCMVEEIHWCLDYSGIFHQIDFLVEQLRHNHSPD